ncbi:TD and POZ domain-containing protein 1 [Caerostris extrusa]|uniref:TD and POZ domain-containing protein 1 n=1 Tax=Caerostris extrusa TaxID=172846 RepID=A0AAV4PV80_CAEEX|nr:TD and POZ domain-containing protein 1 [Caerostris extrusa]
MASQDEGSSKGFTVTWRIENATFFWQRTLEYFSSPVFVVETIEGTKWSLRLYPRGSSSEYYVGFYLYRHEDELEDIEIDYELSFLAADGSVLTTSEAKKVQSTESSITLKCKLKLSTGIVQEQIDTIRYGNANLQTTLATFSARTSGVRGHVLERHAGEHLLQGGHPRPEDDTVQLMLQYMYTTGTDELDWERARRLYAAADKYAVLPLKKMCSIHLGTNLLSHNACQALHLADSHQDGDLKRAAQQFILVNSKEVMNSEEWKLLVETSSELSAETMRPTLKK